MSSAPIEVPDAVRRKALAVGPRGEQWLGDLPSTIAELERHWRISVGASIRGGSESYVAEAIAADGTDAVLKLAVPEGVEGQGVFARELATLLLANGRGYVGVLNADEYHRAMLQERLGRSLQELALPVESQIDIIATTLGQSWRRPSPLPAARTGREQARHVAQAIVTRWDQLGRPCPRPTIEQALDYAHARSKAFDPATSVLIHGDAHPANILEAVRGGGRHGEFKLIDPDGMLSEPAHDLGIPLRDWSDELLARDAAQVGLDWCTQMSRLSGVDSRAIWQWAFLERVSTGLYMMSLGDPHGERLLAVASQWTGREPD